MTESISVLLPVYNGAKSLERAVTSALPQLDRGDELIIVDDGSTDQSQEIAQRFARAHALVRVIALGQNGGLRAALNVGVKAAARTWVARLDSDDEWLPGHVAALRRAIARNPDASLIATDYEVRAPERVLPHRRPTSITSLIFDNAIAHSASCFHRDRLLALGGYLAQTFEDYATWVALVQGPDDFVFVEGASVIVHVRPDSLSRINKREALRLRLENQRRAFRKYRRHLPWGATAGAAAFLALSAARSWAPKQ